MRILHVIPGLTHQRGGPSTVVEALTRHQAQAGHAVRLMTTDQGARHGETPVRLDDAVESFTLSVRGPDRWAYAPSWKATAGPWIAWANVVHVHSLFTYPVHATLQLTRKVGVPTVLRPCGLLHPYSLGRSRLVKALYLQKWGQMLRTSVSTWHYTSDQEAQASWPIGDKPCFVMPNGIEPEVFAVDRTDARRAVLVRRPEIGACPYVLFLGRLHAKKRVDLLLEAFLQTAPEPWKLVVAGPDESGIWPALAKRFLSAQAMRERVVQLEAVRGDEKVQLLAGAHWFALPSEHENFGIAALEALAAGTPVLLSPHVDLAHAAERAGWARVAPLRLAAWTELLKHALSESVAPSSSAPWQEGDERGVAMRTWVNENYAWTGIARQLDARYAALQRAAGLAPAVQVPTVSNTAVIRPAARLP